MKIVTVERKMHMFAFMLDLCPETVHYMFER